MKRILSSTLALLAFTAAAQAPQPVRPANVLPPAGVQQAALPAGPASTFAAEGPPAA